MAHKDELEITIAPDGSVSIEVIGGQGKRCLRLTHELEQALGPIEDRQVLSEFYKPDQDDQVRVEGSLGG